MNDEATVEVSEESLDRLEELVEQTKRNNRLKTSPMGLVLKHLKGEQNAGEGPIEVKTRLADFDVVTFAGPGGQEGAVPGTPLIGFTAQAFREIEKESDVWEFRVAMADSTIKLIYISGADLLLVRTQSKVL